MCGLIGVASTEGNKNRLARLQYMKVGLDIDSWRGWDSTGLALVTAGSLEPPQIYKRNLNGRDFIQLQRVEKYLGDIEKYAVAIGHNRAATTGRGNITDHNAHPFQYGKITLVHNGHIRNTHELKGAQAGAQCPVDSAQVAWAMDANGELETLQDCDGAFCFVWWNSENATLNIARNTDRPLHMAFAAKENTFYWASELTQLLHLLRDVEIDEDIGILYPKASVWYQYSLKNLREYTKTPFVKRQGRRTTTQTTGQAGAHGTTTGRDNTFAGWTDEEWAAWELETTIGQRRSSPVTYEGNIQESEIAEAIRKKVSNQRVNEVKQAGVPTSKKRIHRAKMELKKLNINFEELRNCLPLSWCPYKNQRDLGSVVARTKKDNLQVEVLHVRHAEYREYHKRQNLLVNCINTRGSQKNKNLVVIATVSPRQKQFINNLVKNEAQAKAEHEEFKWIGPNGDKVSLSKFLELSTGGCANCSAPISAVMHEDLVWVADSRPLCKECGHDPGVLEMLGFPNHLRHQAVH